MENRFSLAADDRLLFRLGRKLSRCVEDLRQHPVRRQFSDYKVKVVHSFPDLKVKQVNAFADSPGEWKIVNSFPDYKVQIVDSFPDFTIQYVDAFPGVN